MAVPKLEEIVEQLIADPEQRSRVLEAAAQTHKRSRAKLQRVNTSDVGLFPTCTWDLETSNLQASIGFILCCSIKPWGKEVYTLRIDSSPHYEKNRSDDRWLATRIRQELERYAIAIAYNGQRFDVPFLNTRLMLARQKPLTANIKHLDPIYAARHRMRLHSNRLQTVIETFRLRTKKTPLDGNLWIQAAVGVKKAMDKVVFHCEKDAEALEQVSKVLVQLMDLKFYLVR